MSELADFVYENLPKLVNDQMQALYAIIYRLINNKGYLDAPEGTWTTFLANLILAHVRQTGKIALAVASSGIASTLSSVSKTAHFNFILPLTVLLKQQSIRSIRRNGPLGKLLQET